MDPREERSTNNKCFSIIKYIFVLIYLFIDLFVTFHEVFLGTFFIRRGLGFTFVYFYGLTWLHPLHLLHFNVFMIFPFVLADFIRCHQASSFSTIPKFTFYEDGPGKFLAYLLIVSTLTFAAFKHGMLSTILIGWILPFHLFEVPKHPITKTDEIISLVALARISLQTYENIYFTLFLCAFRSFALALLRFKKDGNTDEQ